MAFCDDLFLWLGSCCGGKTVTAETRLKRDLKLDSIDLWSLLLKTEARYDCAVSDDLLVGVTTAGQFAMVLEHALEEKERVKNERSF